MLNSYFAVVHGETSYFTCEILEANPAVDDVTWLINDELMNENIANTTTLVYDEGYPGSHYTYNTYSDFELVASFPEHQGASLTCAASNVATSDGVSATAELDIIGKVHKIVCLITLNFRPYCYEITIFVSAHTHLIPLTKIKVLD